MATYRWSKMHESGHVTYAEQPAVADAVLAFAERLTIPTVATCALGPER